MFPEVQQHRRDRFALRDKYRVHTPGYVSNFWLCNTADQGDFGLRRLGIPVDELFCIFVKVLSRFVVSRKCAYIAELFAFGVVEEKQPLTVDL